MPVQTLRLRATLADTRLWLVLAGGIGALFLGRLLLRLVEVPGFLGIDTLSLVHAADAAIAGQPIYVDPAGERFFRATLAEYYGPPAYALLWTPLTLLDDVAIRRLSAIAGVVVVGAVIALLTHRHRLAFVATLVGAMLSYAVDVAVSATASSVLVVALVAIGWQWLDRRPLLAGLAVGLAAAFRLYPAAILLALFVARRWTVILAALATAVAVAMVGVVVLGPEVTAQYVVLAEALLRLNVLGETAGPAGIVERLGGPGELVRWISLAAGLGMLGAAGLGLRENRQDLAYGAAIVGMLLVPAQVWGHYLAALVIPAAFLALRNPLYGLTPMLLLPDLEGLGLVWMPALLALEVWRASSRSPRTALAVAA